jgi:hypothetical protein
MVTPNNEQLYRDIVKHYVKDGHVSSAVRSILEKQRVRLKLLPDQARAIETAVLEQHESAPDDQPDDQSSSQSDGSSQDSHRPIQGSSLFTIDRAANQVETSAESQPLDFQQLSQTLSPELSDKIWQIVSQGLHLYNEQGELHVEPDDQYNQSEYNQSEYNQSEYSQQHEPFRVQTDDQQSISERSPDFLTSQPTELAPTELTHLKNESSGIYTHLETLLQAKEWKQADEETRRIMLKITGREDKGWLDDASLERFPCADLHRIDRLWGTNSNEQFSFRIQCRHYFSQDVPTADSIASPRENQERAIRFCKAVDWWAERLEFLKYYRQLTFDTQFPDGRPVPDGHLPAQWFWAIPWWKSLQYGGMGSGRGGCRVDAQALAIFMRKLRDDCEIK